MRVAIISLKSLPFHVTGFAGRFGGGGAEAQTAALAEALAAQGHQVSVVLSDYVGAARQAPRRTAVRLINAFDSRVGLPGIRFFTPRWSGFMAALAEADADIYFQMCAGLATGQTASFCRRHRRAFVFASASDSDVVPRQVRLSLRDRWFYGRGLRAADAIITQHGRQAALLKEHFGLDSTPIGMAVAVPPALPEPAAPPRVLWLGTVRAVKRPGIWLDMARRFPGSRFVMVGGGGNQPGFFRDLKEQAAGIPNVEFKGSVEDTGPFLRSAWLLLNTSRIEGFPNTFLEAWAHGVPTISFFDPDGIVVRHGLGRVVHDEAAMERAVRDLLSSRLERDALGRSGRAYVEREHAPPVVARRFEAVFEQAMSRARARQ